MDYKKLTETKGHFDVNGRIINVTPSNWYVIGNDKHLSGWGRAEGKISKRIVVCRDREQAFRVARNMEQTGFIYVSARPARRELPYYSPSRYVLSFNHADDCPLWNK